MKGQVQVLRLSVWSSVGRPLAARYGVRGVPTFLLLDGAGRLVDYQVGALDPDHMRDKIESLLR